MEHDNDSYIKIIKAKRDALKKKLLSEQQTILKLKNEDSSIRNYCPRPFNRNDLVERLKLMETESSQSIHIPCSINWGDAVIPYMYYHVKCEKCGKECLYETSSWEYGETYSIVANIALLGYNAKICNLCLDCVLKILKDKNFITKVSNFSKLKSLYTSHELNRHSRIDEENINYRNIKNSCSSHLFHCFFFRVDNNEKWHVAESDSIVGYRCLQCFLEIRDEKTSIEAMFKYSTDPIAWIKRMTGIF